ncbi:MAG: bifunctional diaminohydroxyphosphoribosylaminopyrimidine deaminase/5-amino-6-(5-phosphoribosylamino)uracil reductase RibD [Alphaproteobacteria bacterium]
MTSDPDIYYMRMALNLARRGLGHVAPNPSVGCVIVKNGVVVGRGRTAHGGRPHAEAVALEHAGMAAKGATAYVTLEPCAVAGRAGPCAAALVNAGIKRAVIACNDLNPAVYKKGLEVLEEAGVEVRFGVLEEEAKAVHLGFFLRITENRPFVTCKLAVSADGKVAVAPGQRTQISGVLAQRYMHLQRSMHDAILVGAQTFRVDRPKLTTRLEGLEHEPLRVVLGDVDAPGFLVLKDMGVAGVLAAMAEKGITRLLVEGGVKVHQSFLAAGVVDEFQLCRSPLVLGEEGVAGLSGADIEALSGLRLQKTRGLGEDVLEIYGRAD